MKTKIKAFSENIFSELSDLTLIEKNLLKHVTSNSTNISNYKTVKGINRMYSTNSKRSAVAKLSYNSSYSFNQKRYIQNSFQIRSKSDYEWIKNVDKKKTISNNVKNSNHQSSEEVSNLNHDQDSNGINESNNWNDYSELFEHYNKEYISKHNDKFIKKDLNKQDNYKNYREHQDYIPQNNSNTYISNDNHSQSQQSQQHQQQEQLLYDNHLKDEELIMNQTMQMIEQDLESDIMNEILIVEDAKSLTQHSVESILGEGTKFGMITGRIGRRDEKTPETKVELLRVQEESRAHPVVQELITANILPERVIELVDRLRDEIRLEYLSQELYQAIFQKLIKAWLQLDNPMEAQECFCRYFESWYRIQIQIGAIPFLGRPQMQNKELYFKLTLALAENGELGMVQKLVQGYWHDQGSQLILYEDAIILLHSVLRAYIKRGQYVELLSFFSEKFDTTFGRLPAEYGSSVEFTPPTEETYQILFDAFFIDKPKNISGEEYVKLLISYRDEMSNSSEEKVREWGQKLLEHLVMKEEKFDVAHDLFVQLFHSSLNQFSPNALLPHLYDYQYMLELFANVGEHRYFDIVFHALLTDENIREISDAFYALRVKVFSMLSLQDGLNKLNTHFKSDTLNSFSDNQQLSKRAFYDPTRELHYIALVAISNAAVNEKNLDLSWKCIEAYENDCSQYSKEVHQYLFTNVIKVNLELDMQEDALEIFKNHYRSPLFTTEEDTTEYGLFEDVDEVCMLLIESFLKSGDIDMAVRLLEIMKSPPDFLKKRMRKRLEEV